MARIPRKYVLTPGLSLHKTWRGHNKEYNLNTASEKQTYVSYLNEEIVKQSNELQALCLMSNHSHEIYFLGKEEKDIRELSEFFRRHHGRYGMYFNKRHKRSGKVAQERPYTGSIEPEEGVEMEVTFYVHANPVRAGMCKDAKDHVYSTHRLYAYGKREKWMKHVVFPSWYMKLGRSMEERQRRYRRLFDAYMREKGLIKVSHHWFGYGSLLWREKRREQILHQIKADRSAKPPDG